jgi:pSer/pThr/pTyr-binding forkhead associated (FHA) protein
MFIEIVRDNGENSEYNFSQNSIKIGRSKNCDIPLAEEGISREHLQIEIVDGDIFLVDLGSTNGIILNGEVIESGSRVQYMDIFDVILPSGSKVVISIDGKEEAAPKSATAIRRSRAPRQSSMTKTMVLSKKPGSRKKGKKSGKSKKGGTPHIGIVIGLLVVVGYFFLSGDSEPVASKSKVGKSKKRKSRKGKKSKKYNPEVEDKIDLKNYSSSELCSSAFERNVCKTFKINQHPGEGAIVENGHLYIFVNVFKRLEVNYKKAQFAKFNKLDAKSKDIAVGSKFAFNPEIHKLAKAEKLSSIRAYPYHDKVGFKKFRFGILIDAKRDYKYNKQDYQNVFSYYFNDGVDGYFKTYLKKYSKIVDMNASDDD